MQFTGWGRRSRDPDALEGRLALAHLRNALLVLGDVPVGQAPEQLLEFRPLGSLEDAVLPQDLLVKGDRRVVG